MNGDGGQRAFLLRRLHSLTGVVPVGVFLVEHLWTNASALGGRAAFEESVGAIQRMPFLPVVEVVGIFLPLSFHAILGIVIAWRGKPNALRYSYVSNWLSVLQRVSGFVALAFILWHLWEFRVQKAFFGLRHEDFYTVLTAHLSGTRWGVPWMALVYVAGLAAAVFHLANGLLGFCTTWGVVTSRPARARAAWLFGTLGTVLFAVGLETVLFFATGVRFLLPAPHETTPTVGHVQCVPPAPSAKP